MNQAARPLLLFAVALAVLFGAGAAAGRLLNPSAPGGNAMAAGEPHGAMQEHEMAADPVRGLATSENGLRLVVDTPALRRGATTPLRYRIVDERGTAVRDFDVQHTKRMHLIVVRRDLTGFQHLHPTLDADGEWSTPLRVSTGGSYRVFADFAHDGTATTLASDLRVAGPGTLRALPAPGDEATSDLGDSVRLDSAAAAPGDEADLRFTISDDDGPARIERYLGAGGHLVALREGDLAFLHVHPTTWRGNQIGFGAEFPTAGRYRLFLQYRSAGRLHTVAFTKEVEPS